MYCRLLSFLEKYKVLYEYQFGFRCNHSTNLALTILTDKIANALNNDDHVIGVFLDFSKAFDTVNHKILFEKLEHYGIRDLPLKWIKSYLSERSQYVFYNSTKSDLKPITCGVPQGSILGPLLFLLYVNDIVNVSDKLFPILFADDTNVFLQGKNINEMCNVMNIELKKLVIWLNVNKLSLNIKKTHFMIFCKPRVKLNLNTNICINTQEIELVHKTKFLGVIIDDKLLWSDHIQYICTKISKTIGIKI